MELVSRKWILGAQGNRDALAGNSLAGIVILDMSVRVCELHVGTGIVDNSFTVAPRARTCACS